MNLNLTEISKPTQWKPGQSGNLNGRPVGTRQAFSAGFYRDLAEVFAKHGRAAMEKTAIDQPSVFFGICARLLPAETRLTIEAGLPGRLDPGLSALRQADAKLLDSPEILKIRTVLFARAKFVNDITGRFYN